MPRCVRWPRSRDRLSPVAARRRPSRRGRRLRARERGESMFNCASSSYRSISVSSRGATAPGEAHRLVRERQLGGSLARPLHACIRKGGLAGGRERPRAIGVGAACLRGIALPDVDAGADVRNGYGEQPGDGTNGRDGTANEGMPLSRRNRAWRRIAPPGSLRAVAWSFAGSDLAKLRTTLDEGCHGGPESMPGIPRLGERRTREVENGAGIGRQAPRRGARWHYESNDLRQLARSEPGTTNHPGG